MVFGWFNNLPILRDNPYLNLDFSGLFTGEQDENVEDRQAHWENLLLAYGNLNFGRPASEHRRDKREMRRMGARVIATVEDESTPNRESVWVNGNVPHGMAHSIPAFKSKHGAQVGDRKIVWRRMQVFGEPLTVAVVHAPHPRMGREIYQDFAGQLRNVLQHRLTTRDFIVFGDWNKRLGEDPAGLNNLYPQGAWKGERIDGAFISRRLVDRTKLRVVPQPQRKDNHPWIMLTLTEPDKRTKLAEEK